MNNWPLAQGHAHQYDAALKTLSTVLNLDAESAEGYQGRGLILSLQAADEDAKRSGGKSGTRGAGCGACAEGAGILSRGSAKFGKGACAKGATFPRRFLHSARYWITSASLMKPKSILGVARN